MALKNFLPKRTARVDDLDEQQLRAFCMAHPGVVPIESVIARDPTTVVGEISSVQVVTKSGSPWLEVTISDGTGKLVAMWTGRRKIAGVKEGARLVVTGRASPTGPGERLTIYNPTYELL